MSADNYGIVHHYEGGYGLTDGCASNPDPPDLSRPYFTSWSLREVVEKANEGLFEYGWSYSDEVEAELMDLVDANEGR